MQLISHGAAREVTGSCHELRVNGKRILLDCGLFQGRRKEAAVKNSTFDFNPATDIDVVVISHAHIDHTGRLPLLVKKGYQNPIYCTYATKDLCHIMLQDSGYIQEKDEEYFRKHMRKSMMPCDGPLYTQEDAKLVTPLMKGVNYNQKFDVVEGVKAQYFDAGHILGAAIVVLEIEEEGKITRLGFTGDLGRNCLPIIRDPTPMPPVDILISESTYGNRLHEDIATAKDQLRDVVVRTAKRGGKILIPAFSVERTQEIVYELHLLWDAKEIPQIPIFIDSPLATRVTEVFQKHPECYDKEMYEQFLSRQHNPFQFTLVTYTESVEKSKELNMLPGPAIIMAGSGMCEAGRIRHHLKNNLEDPRTTVIAVGYMAENTLGRRIIEPEIKAVKIFDRMYQKKAETVYINAYSGHADANDLDVYIDDVIDRTAIQTPESPLKKIFFVHGEETNMQTITDRTAGRHPSVEVIMPERGVEYEI